MQNALETEVDLVQKEGVLTKALCRMSQAVLKLSDRIERIKGKKPEFFVVFLYCFSHMLMLIVHEPWFDEALAWLIARDSSVYELLFVAPHYEGHPSLWHLVLLPFAKLGASYELSLSVVSLIFSGSAVYLIVFKSPFKRVIRLLIPFTYYYFYQYSVISRPYCMMMLAFVVMALTYSNRNTHSGRFVLSLTFLCMTSAYGIVIAGGICIAWLIQMWRDAHKVSNYVSILKLNGKIIWLCLLLGYAIFLMIRIIPAEDAYAVVRNSGDNVKNGFVVRLLYVFFASISDLCLTNVYYNTGTLHGTEMSMIELFIAVIIGGFILALVIRYALNKKKFIEFIIPYILFGGFGTVVYLYDHHIGILLLYLIYWLWTVLSDEKNEDKQVSQKLKNQVFENPLMMSLTRLLMVAVITIPIFWSISSVICDIFYEYGYGRNEYNYLSRHGLDNSSMLAEWVEGIKIKEDLGYSETVIALSSEGVSIAPYLSGEVILNSLDNLGFSYMYTHKFWHDEEVEKQKEGILKQDLPEVLIGHTDVDGLYGKERNTIANYTKVYQRSFSCIKKGVPGKDVSYIYVRNDIAEKLELEQIY